MKKINSFNLVKANAANVVMAMFATMFVTILGSCTKEEINYHATSAKGLMVEIDSAMTWGNTQIWFDGTAKDVNGNVLDGNGEVNYVGLPKIYVDQLGMPTSLVTSDGTNFSFSDGWSCKRSFTWNSNTGVNGSATGSWVVTTITPVNDSTEIATSEFRDDWAIWTNNLPEAVTASLSDVQSSKVIYLRVVKPQAPKPDVVTYEWTAPVDEVAGGVAYVDVTVKRLRNGVVEKSWGVYTSGIRFGEYKPSVASVVVNSYNFNTTDWLEALATEADKVNQGDEGAFTIVNSAKQQAHLSVVFGAPADANGSTEREIAGHVNLWSYDVIFTDSETGHVETISFKAKAETVKNEVENGSYVRTVNILCNGEVVKVQNGSVALTLAQ